MGGGLSHEKEKRFERHGGGRNNRTWETRCGGERGEIKDSSQVLTLGDS